ncbi:MAG: methyl-accepting chemotaxis protein [Ruminococcus sp.]|nr:methyl-accepting chemotaxis protein [Ruminococcus sp.]
MKTIRSKMILAMFSVSILIIALLSIFSILYINKSVSNTLHDTIEPLAQQSVKTFDSAVKDYGDKFSSLVESKAFTDAESDEARIAFVSDSFSKEEDENSYAIYSTDGTVRYSTPGLCSEAITANDISLALSSGTTVFGDITPIKNNIYFSILYPVVLSDGKQAVAATTLKADALNNIISDITLGKSGYAYIVKADGEIILHKEIQRAINRFNPVDLSKSDSSYKEYADFLTDATTSASGSFEYEYNKENYIAGYAASAYFGGTLCVVSESDSFMTAGSNAFKNIVFIGIILVIVTIIVSIVFAARMSKPIVSTTNRIRELAQGNLTDRVEVSYSKDEIGILSGSLADTIVRLRQYITLITVALTQISEGNMTHRVEGDFKGDFIKIKSTFNEILESLGDTFASINTSAEQVNSGAVQVSNSAQALSQGSTQQASAIEELSATLNEVSTQVKQNSKDAKNAYNIVTENTKAISACNEDMTNMLDAMEQIHSTSAEIANIIKVIDEISFQTNILALNAAVEAAREGSKGFGVVADEVRRLASRSAEAAKQTAALIENSTKAVNKGSELAAQTAHSLGDIVNDSVTIQGLVKNITDASAQQAEAIVQINTGVDQISAVVATNTATAIGAASASEELSQQSLILKNMIAKFRLSEEDDNIPTNDFYSSDDDDDDEPADTDIDSDSEDELKIVLNDDDDKY